VFGVQFVFRDIPNIHIPFDMETFRSYEGEFIIVTTDAETGKVQYFTQKDVDEDFEVFHATCALPLILPPATLYGREYFDGGLSNPIPIDKVLEDGNEKVLIVLTRTKDYRKTRHKKDIVAARQMEKKYPEIARAVVNRYKKYNHSLEVCQRLEEQGKAVIIRPDVPLVSLEKDVEVLRSSWQSGYDKAMERMDDIKALFL
jgi:predicted patatin/cPLA2 family phospholipase